MNQFNLGNFVNNFFNSSSQMRGNNPAKSEGPGALPPQIPSEASMHPTGLPPAFIKEESQFINSQIMRNLRLNNLSNMERNLYLKELMNLPKELEDFLSVVQNKTVENDLLKQLVSQTVDVSVLSELIQKNAKAALNKLVFVMSESAKQGVSDLSEIKDAIKLINACVAASVKENPNQVLKNFMLLYLPWLPLQEGVDFELEFESQSSSEESGEASTLTILISTQNYGNISITLVLLGVNSIDIFVNCCSKFPKEDLLKRIQCEVKKYSLQSSVNFEEKELVQKNETRQAKISISQLSQVNPFLLLMANAVIKHTLEIDSAHS